MDIEIFVHGVPNGQSFWGKEDDRNYFGNFYAQSNSDVVKFLIQTRSSNGKTYCYYNYIVCKDVVGNDGREGSYFGLSIRSDVYLKDFLGIYKILDYVFTVHVLNNILNFQKGKYKYDIANFDSASHLMDSIKKTIWDSLVSMLRKRKDDICGLSGFTIGGNNVTARNLYEITPQEVQATVKQYGKIALSPYYPTVREDSLAQQYESKLLSVKQQYEERYNAELNAKDQRNRSLNDSLASKQMECTNLQAAVSQKDKLIGEKDAAIVNLNRQIGQNQKATKNIDLIKEPVLELASILGGQRGNRHEEKVKQKKGELSFLKRLIPLVNLVILLLVLVLLLFKTSPKESKPDKSLESLQDSIYQLKEENEELRNQHSSSEGGNKSADDFHKNVTIDVSKYNEKSGELLKVGKVYSATIQVPTTNEGTKWSIEGGQIVDGDNGAKVTFVPKSDKVTLTYQNANGESASRSLMVQP